MKRITVILITSTILLTACVSLFAVTPSPVPTATSAPTKTPPPIPSPTAPPGFIDLKSGGSSLPLRSDLQFDLYDSSINISDRAGRLVISLNGRSYIASEYSLESFLGKYMDEMARRGGTFKQSDPYDIVIDGVNGIAIDLTGDFLGAPIAGKAISISPGKDFIVFGFAMSNLGTNENSWTEDGSLIFETILSSIHFKRL